MSGKYNYDNYTLTVDIRSANELSITASDLLGGDIYINEGVVLDKIKADTVVAALSRKT